MSYMKIPNKVFFGSASFVDHYVGEDDDYGGYLFKINLGGGDFTHVKTSGFIQYELSDSTGLTWQSTQGYGMCQEVGGEPVFFSGNWKLYYVPSLAKWIMMENPPWIGYIPRTTASFYTDPDTGVTEYTYEGDIWWESSSLKTTPWNGELAGNFIFGMDGWSSRYPDLSTYEGITHSLSGDVANKVATVLSGSGPTGMYSDGSWIGFPEWYYTYNGTNTYITKYGSGDSQYTNLQKYNRLRYLDGHYLTTRWTGWVATNILGAPNAYTNKGFYATTTEPEVTQNFTLQWYHFVPDDPDDPDSDGVIQHDSSWTDDDGVVHNMPDITVTWDRIRDAWSVHVSQNRIVKKVAFCEAAIWR